MTTSDGLREHFRLTDEQLDSITEESELLTLGGLFGPWRSFTGCPGLRLSNGEKHTIHADPNLIDNKMKVEAALKMWRNHDILQATFRNLLEVVLKLEQGDVAVKICKYIGTASSHHPTVQDNSSSRPSLHEDTIISSYKTFLRGRYSIQLPSSSTQWPPVPTNKVFKLAMISKETVQRGKIDDEFVQLSITGKVDDILQRKIPVDLENIIPTNTETGRNVVLAEGAPGSGKSTLSLHICQEWGRGKLFQQYKAVILVRLRDPLVQKAITIVDILPCANKTMCDQVESAILSNYGEDILWVLDGWDELPSDLSVDCIINKLIEPSKFKESPVYQSDLIITSRPVSSASLHPLVSARVEVLGFTPHELKQYFTECMKGDSKAVQSLLDRIKENPVVEGSCYLPLNASIIANVYIAGNHTLPNTVHGIFSSLVQCSLQRYLKDRLGKSTVVNSITYFKEIPTELRRSYTQLCKLAHDGIRNNKAMFTPSDLESLHIPADICEVGFLQAVPSIVSTSQEVYYSFLHLSIQELLAAIYISHMPSSEQIAVFQEFFDQARFNAVFQFYAGITKLKTSRRLLSILPQSMCPAPASVYDLIRKKILQKQQKDISASKSLPVSLLHCLYEAEDPSLCHFVAKQLNGKLYFSSTTLTPLDCLSIGYFLAVACTIHSDFLVYFRGCSIGDQGCKYLTNSFCKYLDSHKSVTTQLNLTVSGNDIHKDGADHVAELLQSTDVVNKLNLSLNPITDEGFKSLCKALLTNTSLTELDVSYCSLVIFDSCGLLLTEMLMRNKTLKILKLSGNTSLGVSACHYIATGLKDNTSLKTLHLTYCDLTDQDLDTLSAGLNNYLERLHFNGNDKITLSGLQSLANKLLTPTQLKRIWLTNHLESYKSVVEDVNKSRRRIGLQEIRLMHRVGQVVASSGRCV